ncbi:uncharacterized protein IL334_006125 [Kwoniella shivajii]|uniref:Uncharacterized protein n=1 Tax=Kwoniella shivajii TaxID=564305 RepID=A0ABZ1D857_9TREE|nr:hypothetical protein IL334_006125 [Kwoniella shivajii]
MAASSQNGLQDPFPPRSSTQLVPLPEQLPMILVDQDQKTINYKQFSFLSVELDPSLPWGRVSMDQSFFDRLILEKYPFNHRKLHPDGSVSLEFAGPLELPRPPASMNFSKPYLTPISSRPGSPSHESPKLVPSGCGPLTPPGSSSSGSSNPASPQKVQDLSSQGLNSVRVLPPSSPAPLVHNLATRIAVHNPDFRHAITSHTLHIKCTKYIHQGHLWDVYGGEMHLADGSGLTVPIVLKAMCPDTFLDDSASDNSGYFSDEDFTHNVAKAAVLHEDFLFRERLNKMESGIVPEYYGLFVWEEDGEPWLYVMIMEDVGEKVDPIECLYRLPFAER